MARLGRTLLFVAFVAVVAAAAWAQFAVQRSRADEASATNASVATVFDAVVQAENSARDYTVARDELTLDAYTASRSRLAQAITRARARVGHSGPRAQLETELTRIGTWGTAAEQDVQSAMAGGVHAADARRAAARGEQLAGIRAANDALVRALERHDHDERDDAGVRGLIVVIGCCALFAALNWLLFSRTERRDRQERDRQLAFAEQLQRAHSEDVARTMLARHLEVVAPGTMALVTGADDSTAAGRPVTVAGERVATVLLRSERELRPAEERLVHDSILRAGPVLANLRTLAVAQARAATDPLTGLGNRRLVEDALGRLVAQSARTAEPFAVAVVDLDRFKSVNDSHGHATGDALLVGVAGVLDHATREYDIVGRLGGDEFIVLLAGLDVDHAQSVMDRCRAAIAALRVGEPSVGVTASIGVAPAPTAASCDAAALVRAADEAAYVAKARGGDCVVVTPPPDAATAAQASALRA
jgi:diguanylate cyclase (GGDEF)-like protein